LAFAFNGIGIPAAATGLVHPVWAMVAMSASVSAVLLNSFGGRLLPRRTVEPPSTLILTVPTIHCQGCVAAIGEGLLARAGVVAVEGDPAARTITVHYRPRAIGPDGVRAAVRALGHVVE